jgi:hypothetical protein
MNEPPTALVGLSSLPWERPFWVFSSLLGARQECLEVLIISLLSITHSALVVSFVDRESESGGL